jgi:hypothetical protein
MVKICPFSLQFLLISRHFLADGILNKTREYRIIPYNFNTSYKTQGVPLIGTDIAKFNPSKGD